jgi:hypothetical protein
LARLMNGITDVLVSWQADQSILGDEQVTRAPFVVQRRCTRSIFGC